MATVEVRLDLDRLERDIFVELMAPEGVIELDVRRRGLNVKDRIIELIHERADEETPGGLADSIFGETFRHSDDTWAAHISSDKEYAVWFEDGTGLFGPRHSPIVPTFARFMKFTHRGLGRVVYASKVSGQEPHHVFRDGMEAANP